METEPVRGMLRCRTWRGTERAPARVRDPGLDGIVGKVSYVVAGYLVCFSFFLPVLEVSNGVTIPRLFDFLLRVAK